MTIIKNHVHLNRRIRQLNKTIKRCKNEAQAYHAEAEYHQAVHDYIVDKFHLEESENKGG